MVKDIHRSLIKYLLSACSVSDSILNRWDTSLTKTGPLRIIFQQREVVNKW